MAQYEFLHDSLSLLHGEQRMEALYSLAMIGLHQFVEKTGQLALDIPSLRGMYAESLKILEEELSKSNRHRSGTWRDERSWQTKSNPASYFPIKASEASIPSAPRTSVVHVQPSSSSSAPRRVLVSDKRVLQPADQSHRIRQPRPDSMARFPFADDRGDVSSVFHPSKEEEKGNDSKFLEMGLPAQRRIVNRVFEEMKSGNAGLLVSDIPEALRNIGLFVPIHLEKSFQGNDSNSLSKINNNQDAIGLLRPLILNQTRFQLLIDMYIRELKTNNIHRVSAEHFFRQEIVRSYGGSGGVGDGNGDGNDLLRDKENSEIRSRSAIRVRRELDLQSSDEEDDSNRSFNRNSRSNIATTDRKSAYSSSANILKSMSPTAQGWKDSHTSRLRQTRSRIADQVKKDKAAWMRNNNKRQSQSQQRPSRPSNVGFDRQPEIYEPRLSRTNSSQVHDFDRNDNDDLRREWLLATQSRSGRRKARDEPSRTGLYSLSADTSNALRIAENFLNGSVAREISHRPSLSQSRRRTTVGLAAVSDDGDDNDDDDELRAIEKSLREANQRLSSWDSKQSNADDDDDEEGRQENSDESSSLLSYDLAYLGQEVREFEINDDDHDDDEFDDNKNYIDDRETGGEEEAVAAAAARREAYTVPS